VTSVLALHRFQIVAVNSSLNECEILTAVAAGHTAFRSNMLLLKMLESSACCLFGNGLLLESRFNPEEGSKIFRNVDFLFAGLRGVMQPFMYLLC
jgi:hypothetical protein